MLLLLLATEPQGTRPYCCVEEHEVALVLPATCLTCVCGMAYRAEETREGVGCAVLAAIRRCMCNTLAGVAGVAKQLLIHKPHCQARHLGHRTCVSQGWGQEQMMR